MEQYKENLHVIHPKSLIKEERSKISKFNTKLAVRITNGIGSMWSAYLFAVLSIMSLPAIFVLIDPNLRPFFPKWIIATSLITLIAWISQNFLQLVLLPIIMVGQNVIQARQQAKTEADHRTLSYIANLQEEHTKILSEIKESLLKIKQ